MGEEKHLKRDVLKKDIKEIYNSLKKDIVKTFSDELKQSLSKLSGGVFDIGKLSINNLKQIKDTVTDYKDMRSKEQSIPRSITEHRQTCPHCCDADFCNHKCL